MAGRVSELMDQLGAGDATLDAVVERLPSMLRPMVKRAEAADQTERFRRDMNDVAAPEQPTDSWADVRDAYIARDVITEDQYYELLRRVARPDATTVSADE